MNTSKKNKILKRKEDLMKTVECGLNQKISPPIKPVKSKRNLWKTLNTWLISMTAKRKQNPKPDKSGSLNFLKPVGNTLLVASILLQKISSLMGSMMMPKECWPKKNNQKVSYSKRSHINRHLFLRKRPEATRLENIQQQCQPNLSSLWDPVRSPKRKKTTGDPTMD